jgi:hypothetical protein
MTNRATYEAGYNSEQINNLLMKFRKARGSLVNRLEKLDEIEIRSTSVHPRLKQKMRIIDWVYFMCEHDDHHLTSIRILSADK